MHLGDDHPAVFRISWTGTEAILAFDVAAALVLCGLNVVVSTPAEVMTIRIHLGRVSLDTRLYGLVKLTKKFSFCTPERLCSLEIFFKASTNTKGWVGWVCSQNNCGCFVAWPALFNMFSKQELVTIRNLFHAA